MKLNFKPTNVAFIDFETQSACPLTTVHKYTTHPSTKVLTVCVKADGVMHRMGAGEIDLEKLEAIGRTHTMVAHNAAFDAAVWERVAKLPEVEWFDTLPCARKGGLPGKLDDLSKIVTGRGKDKNGKLLIDMLCVLKGKPPAIGPAHKLLLDYNQRDVEELEAVYEHVKEYVEPDVMAADRFVNDRGIPINREFLEALSKLYDANVERSRDEFEHKLGDVNPGSPKQMIAWLKSQGFEVQSINKSAYKTLLERPEDFFVGDSDMDAAFELVAEAMALRSEIVRVGRGKLDAAADALDSDGRLREQLVYYGAHTGRWSARKLQPHNMAAMVHLHGPSMHRIVQEPTMENVHRAVAASIEQSKQRGQEIRVTPGDVLNGSLRHIVQSDNFLFADYNAIELRGTAYMARCGRMLELLNSGKSIYLDTGERIFNRKLTKQSEQYGFCKQLVLGCIYGMSGAKFEYMCKLRNVKTRTLQEAGIGVKESVRIFRETYPEIPAVWRAYGEAVEAAVRGATREAGRCTFFMRGANLIAVLPSQRELIYRNARIEMLIPGYAALYGMPAEPKPTVVFDKPNGGKGFLYGSRVCENVVQATSRDFLATSLVNTIQLNFSPCLHVHDEECTEDDPGRLVELCSVMSDPPAWAPDFPLVVEGFSGPIWSKYTESYIKCEATRGRVK